MERRAVNPWKWQDQFGFAQAIEVTGAQKVLVCSGQTSVDANGEGVQVLHTTLAPGQETPWHFHSGIRDTFYGVQGPVTILTRAPEGRVELQPGETFVVQSGQSHRVLNETGGEAEFLLIQGIGEYDFHAI